jgi:hypothetical protein
MSEGTSGGEGAVATSQTQATSTPASKAHSNGNGATASERPSPSGGPQAPQGEAKTTGPGQWGDADEKAFFELAKRSPYRAKIKGEERAIDSPESLRELLNHAQRGIGASKVVEQAKKEMESARQAREEALAHRQLLERASRGDFEARRALGLVTGEELQAKEREWAEVPPEVRQLYEERNRYAQELESMRAEALERAEQAKRQEEERQTTWARRTAINAAQEVAKLVGLDEGNAERIMPHVAGAIADLRAYGLELGKDMTPELIVERVKERIGDFNSTLFDSFPETKAMELLSPRLSKLDDGSLMKALGPQLARRVAKMVAREIAGARAQPQPPQEQEAQARANTRPPLVLDPMLSRLRNGR